MRHFLFKIFIIITLLIGIPFQSNAQGTNVNLIVTTIDGVEQIYQLTEESRMYFQNGETLVIEDGSSTIITFALSNVRKLVCSEVTGTAEEHESQLQILPNPTRNSFIIRHLAKTCQARIYSLDGRMVKAFQASEGSVVDMGELPQGMYLLHINGQTLKLMKL